jgi:hypothetical protein|tara:strand:+ start:24 stop:227 length:204 start_codon:yes stop_codon:yes gene_type:complete
MANMAEKLVDKKYYRGREIESNNRLSIISADQPDITIPTFQILSKFLHSFRPVDLTVGAAVAAAAQH